MLTVKQINEVSFGKAGFSGYKPEDVDNFIDEVAASFQQLEAERDEALKQAKDLAGKNSELAAKNAEIQEKLAILAQKIESYREEEDGIKDALVSAQKLARDSVQDAKDKAELILQDAKDNARRMMDDAKIEATKAAREYMAQADEKKEELEEIKRQVTAFRSSLLEMYKKHLEDINHIPVFRQKEKPEETDDKSTPEPAPAVQEEPEPARMPEPAPKPVAQPAPREEPEREEPPKPAAEPVEAPAPVKRPPQHSQQRRPQPAPRPAAREEERQPTLHDRIDYTKQAQPEERDGLPEEEDLSGVGIDVKAYSDIPESLRREKSNHFSNLEFGEDVDLGNKKRKK